MEGHPRFIIPDEAETQGRTDLQLSEDESQSSIEQGVADTRSQGTGERTEPRESVHSPEEALRIMEKRLRALTLPPPGHLRAAGWRFALQVERSRIELIKKAENIERSPRLDPNLEAGRTPWKDRFERMLLGVLRRLLLPLMRLTLAKEYQERFEQYSLFLKSNILPQTRP